MRGPNSPHWKGGNIKRTCLICQKVFFVRRYKIKDGFGKFCSRECMGIYEHQNYSGKNSFVYKGGEGPSVKTHCEFCNKEYLIFPSEIGRSKFCSKKCHNLNNYIKMKKQETSIEAEVRKWLDEIEADYAPQKLLVNTTFADFFVEPNLAIYCDGKYWHSKPSGIQRDNFVNKVLKKNGYLVLRLTEDEIKSNIGKTKLTETIKMLQM